MRRTLCHHDMKPKCKHPNCRQNAEKDSDWCYIHKDRMEAKVANPTGYSPEMMRKLMAGSAAIRPRSYSDYKVLG